MVRHSDEPPGSSRVVAAAASEALPEGFLLWRAHLDHAAQASLAAPVLAASDDAGAWFKPVTPRWGQPFSVAMANLGPLGWIADRAGYRYATTHPEHGRPWPAIPDGLLALWHEATGYPAPPECCLVNLYRGRARMGLHQDRDEQALDAPVLSVSLGDSALFRIGGLERRDPTASIWLHSGDVLVMGGPSRLRFHGIDRVAPGTSDVIPGGGRLNLTLRRVTVSS